MSGHGQEGVPLAACAVRSRRWARDCQQDRALSLWHHAPTEDTRPAWSSCCRVKNQVKGAAMGQPGRTGMHRVRTISGCGGAGRYVRRILRKPAYPSVRPPPPHATDPGSHSHTPVWAGVLSSGWGVRSGEGSLPGATSGERPSGLLLLQGLMPTMGLTLISSQRPRPEDHPREWDFSVTAAPAPQEGSKGLPPSTPPRSGGLTHSLQACKAHPTPQACALTPCRRG